MTFPIEPGVGIAGYNGGDWKRLLTSAFRKCIVDAQPQIFRPHAGLRGLIGQDPDHPDAGDPTAVIAEVRSLVPGVRVHYGCGCDGWTSYLHEHPDAAGQKVVRGLLRQIFAMARSLRVECISADQEGVAEAHPDAGRLFATLFFDVAAEYPEIVVSHSSYDDPIAVRDPATGRDWGGHRAYPYKIWLGGTDPRRRAAFTEPQNYCAPESGAMASKGALARRIEKADRSYVEAVKKGWVVPNMPRARYLQAHGVPFGQTVTYGSRDEVVFLWAGPNELDGDGATAVGALAWLCRHHYFGPRGIADFQTATAALGLYKGKIDNIFGDLSLAAMRKAPPDASLCVTDPSVAIRPGKTPSL